MAKRYTDARLAALENEVQMARDSAKTITAAAAADRMKIATLEAENAALREGLAFYRDGFAYHPKRSSTGISLSTWKPKAQLLEDCGERARALLQGQGGADA